MSELITVVETAVYLTKAARIMADDERARIVDTVASRPDAGVIIAGSKGLRKLRIALAGRGKSGGGGSSTGTIRRVIQRCCCGCSPRTRRTTFPLPSSSGWLAKQNG